VACPLAMGIQVFSTIFLSDPRDKDTPADRRVPTSHLMCLAHGPNVGIVGEGAEPRTLTGSILPEEGETKLGAPDPPLEEQLHRIVCAARMSHRRSPIYLRNKISQRLLSTRNI
jgi:hypothetical protein